MSTERATVGGKDGYSINSVIETDEDGNIISTRFEVVDPDGYLVAECDSIDEAYSEIQQHISRNSGPAL